MTKRHRFDPFAIDGWDPSNVISSTFPEFYEVDSAIVNARVNRKATPESHVFKADLPELKKEEVKVEVEDD